MNLCNACSSNGEVLRFVTVNKTSIPQFRVFFRNIVENINFSFRSYRISDADDAETHLLSTVPACIPPFTRGQGAVIRRIGRGHFRSRDENGGQTIRSAIPANPKLYVNFTAVSSIDPELLPIEGLHCRNSECRVFLRKIVTNIKIFRLYRLVWSLPVT